ncbi:baculoviral IAP repeat-containing protein 7-A [Trichonephila clavata]|uniref:Baculoviral IAP repeat-containing protein 7-A n=1 Tax=Trichonephila clavata TaxID=2740835 RepID=A0A8X6HIM4_TRICU|nr:baculoviral IAP repeat-containing protein 7-A [Trichonephila clavata]
MTDGVPDVRALRKMSDLKSRLLTFKGWPLIMLSAKQLAEHGFYYTGISDIVTCFYCNISLGNWKINDDPLIEHKKFSPHCAYLELIKMKSIKPPNTTDETIEDEVLRQACELFSKSTVQKVAVANFRSTGQHFKSLEDVCEAVFKFDAKPAKSVTLESGNRVEGNEEGDISLFCKLSFCESLYRIKEEASTSPPPPRDSRRNSPRDSRRNSPRDSRRNSPRDSRRNSPPRDSRRNSPPRDSRRNSPPRDSRRNTFQTRWGKWDQVSKIMETLANLNP